MDLLSEKSSGRIEHYRDCVNDQTSKRDLRHQKYYRKPDQPSFLTGIQAPKSERLHFSMRPADEIAELNSGTKFLSYMWPCVAWKSFLRIRQN
jgi:hypothetical protein